MPRSSSLPAALAALLAIAVVPPVGTATAAAKKKPPTSARYEIVGVDVRGTATSTLDDGDTHYRYSGVARYAATEKKLGTFTIPPAGRRDEPVAFTVRPLVYTGTSRATISTKDTRWQCGARTSEEAAPDGLTAAVSFRGDELVMQWILVPPVMLCPSGSPAWSIPGMPSFVTTRRYVLSFFFGVRRGQLVKLQPQIDSGWSNDGGDHRIRWSGYVKLKRL